MCALGIVLSLLLLVVGKVVKEPPVAVITAAIPDAITMTVHCGGGGGG